MPPKYRFRFYFITLGSYFEGYEEFYGEKGPNSAEAKAGVFASRLSARLGVEVEYEGPVYDE